MLVGTMQQLTEHFCDLPMTSILLRALVTIHALVYLKAHLSHLCYEHSFPVQLQSNQQVQHTYSYHGQQEKHKRSHLDQQVVDPGGLDHHTDG